MSDANESLHVKLPIMVSVTIELSGSMLIGTDATTIAAILEPFDILSLGFNCGTGLRTSWKSMSKPSVPFGQNPSVYMPTQGSLKTVGLHVLSDVIS